MLGYYYSTDGVNTVGPIDINGLAALLRSRTITRQTPAIIEGQAEWLTVGDYLPNTLRSPRLNHEEDFEGDNAEIDPSRKKSKKAPTRPVFAFVWCFLLGPFGLLFLNWKLAVLALVGSGIIGASTNKQAFWPTAWVISICLGTLWSIAVRRK